MKQSRGIHPPIRRSGVADYKKFYSPRTTETSTTTTKSTKHKISDDLTDAYVATEKLSKNLDELLRDSDFTSHRLWREGLTSNQAILRNLIETINTIRARLEEKELGLKYPDYFTK